MIRIIPSSIRSSIRGVVSGRSTTLAINSTLTSNTNITSLRSSINQPPTYLNTTHHHQQQRSLHLTPREIDHLQLHSAGRLAQHRLARGLKLNIVEAKALIAMQMMELVRNGKANTVTTASDSASEGNIGKIVQREGSVSNLMSIGTQLLGRNQVLPGVANLIKDVQVEATFPDGTKVRYLQVLCEDCILVCIRYV